MPNPTNQPREKAMRDRVRHRSARIQKQLRSVKQPNSPGGRRARRIRASLGDGAWRSPRKPRPENP